MSRKESRREYASRVMAERKALGLEKLGGKCRHCGAVEGLEFDHIDPTTKSFVLTKKWGCRMETWLAELAKCQLLCRPCHERTSILEAGTQVAKGPHGTISSARHCRCDLCVGAERAWQRQYDAKRRTPGYQSKAAIAARRQGA